VPADKPVKVPVPAYGVVPPVAVTVTVPFDPPLHVTLVLVDEATNTAGCVTVALIVVEQPLASVTV
jgi:hypothetical protein